MTPDPDVPADRSSVAIELTGISRQFGAVRALEDVTFAVRAGTVHAVLGENGAGKTTLMRIAYGLLAPDAGHVRLFGQEARAHSVREAMRAGIGMVHQHLSLVPTLSAAENIALGRGGVFRPDDARRELERLATQAGLVVDADVLVRDLSIVEQQRLEIVKAFARGARALILDEPTSGLAPTEIDDLLKWIRGFAERGGTVVLVTHRLREALAVADDITILRRGRVAHAVRHIGDDGAGRPSADELARAMFPEAPPAAARAQDATIAESVAALEDVSVVDARHVFRLRSASLNVRRGEIVGVAAVEGAGHRELLRVLAGLLQPSAGRALLPPRVAVVPSDRLREAIVPSFSLVENVALRGAGSRRGILPWKELTRATGALVERYGIAATSVAAPARALSGGNQQRLVLARELSEDVDLVVADDPTRGLDLRAAAFVHEQLRDVAARGAAVVFHASDIDEVLSLATRVLVLFHGTLRAVPSDRELVGRAMVGST